MIAEYSKYNLLIFIVVILFHITPAVFSLDAILTIQKTAERIEVSVHAEGIEISKILTSLEEGLTSEILFQLRIYTVNEGFFSFLGNKLIMEKKISYIAFKDFFLNQFVIQKTDNELFYFETIDSFISNFSYIEKYPLIESNKINSSNYYILARVRVNPVKLEPPLHIITLFKPIGRTSRWVEYRFSNHEKADR